MSGMNYAKAKQERQARGAIHAAPDTASTGGWGGQFVSLRGWRTEWDGEPFPVTVSRQTADLPESGKSGASRVACA